MRGIYFLFGFVVFIVIVLEIDQAHATGARGCEPLDLREDTCPNGRPRFPSVRDQGYTNYCWAYSLADYYSFVTCEDFSGLHLGLSTNLSFGDESPSNQKVGSPTSFMEPAWAPLNSGMRVENAHTVLKNLHGVCYERDYPSNRNEIMKPNDFSGFMQGMWDRRREPNLLGCERHPVPDVQFTLEANKAHMPRAIQQSLERHSPIFLHVNPGLVADRRAGSQGGHVTLIVGRRLGDRGQCQLLMRDPTPVTSTAWQRTSDGYVWIDESAVVRATVEITTARPFTAPTSMLADGTTARTPVSSAGGKAASN